MTLLPLAHAAAIVLDRPAYLRRRVRVQAGLRFARLLFQLWQFCLTRQAAVAWGGKMLLLGKGNPARAMVASFAAPVAALVHNLMNPCPLALQPAIAATVLYITIHGWMPMGCHLWRPRASAGGWRRSSCLLTRPP